MFQSKEAAHRSFIVVMITIAMILLTVAATCQVLLEDLQRTPAAFARFYPRGASLLWYVFLLLHGKVYGLVFAATCVFAALIERGLASKE